MESLSDCDNSISVPKLRHPHRPLPNPLARRGDRFVVSGSLLKWNNKHLLLVAF